MLQDFGVSSWAEQIPGPSDKSVVRKGLALSFFALLWVADRRVIRMRSSKFHTEM